jgi:hypothetical protein
LKFPFALRGLYAARIKETQMKLERLYLVGAALLAATTLVSMSATAHTDSRSCAVSAEEIGVPVVPDLLGDTPAFIFEIKVRSTFTAPLVSRADVREPTPKPAVGLRLISTARTPLLNRSAPVWHRTVSS